jgi:hypothetical protein
MTKRRRRRFGADETVRPKIVPFSFTTPLSHAEMLSQDEALHKSLILCSSKRFVSTIREIDRPFDAIWLLRASFQWRP